MHGDIRAQDCAAEGTGTRLGLRIDPFDEYGHRIFEMVGPKGPIEVVQGITEITPKWTKVEAIEGIHHYIWTMRIATSTAVIPNRTASGGVDRRRHLTCSV